MTCGDVYIGPFLENDDTFDTTSCVICCEEFERNTKIIKLNCDHIYHMDCFMKYRDIQVENKSNVICAICRQEPELEKIDNLYQIYSIVDEGYMSDSNDVKNVFEQGQGLELTDAELHMNLTQFKQLPQCLGCHKDIQELDEAIYLKCTHRYHWDCLETIAIQQCSRVCLCGTGFSAKIMPNIVTDNSANMMLGFAIDDYDFSDSINKIQPQKQFQIQPQTQFKLGSHQPNIAHGKQKDYNGGWGNLFSSLYHNISVRD